MWLHQRCQQLSFITSQEINVTNLREVKSAREFWNSSHMKLQLFFFFPDWCQAHMRDPGTGCITLSVHPSLQSSFTQKHGNTSIWTCLIDPPGSVEGVFQLPGVGHKQTRERWSCQRYWFPTTASLTGSTQKFLQTHRVGSDGRAVQLCLLWLHETGRDFWS